jgi:Fibronectin type III domain
LRKIFLFFILLLSTYAIASARSGCCSSHGGVCGCSCCDGTPLSATCLPYYPNCGGGGFVGSPSNLGGHTLSDSQCVLTWSDNATNESYFEIEAKSQAVGFYSVAGTVGANVTQATIGNLTPATTYSFRVRGRGTSGDSDYSNEMSLTTLPDLSTLCQAPAACFGGSRFKVDAQWKTLDGRSGSGTVVQLTDDSGYFWFFAASNVEVVFKVLNACSVNHAFWFYAGGLTNVQVNVTVTDTKTGATKTYQNLQGNAFQPIQDTAAFTTCP